VAAAGAGVGEVVAGAEASFRSPARPSKIFVKSWPPDRLRARKKRKMLNRNMCSGAT
jgi:hypothetical protein